MVETRIVPCPLNFRESVHRRLFTGTNTILKAEPHLKEGGQEGRLGSKLRFENQRSIEALQWVSCHSRPTRQVQVDHRRPSHGQSNKFLNIGCRKFSTRGCLEHSRALLDQRGTSVRGRKSSPRLAEFGIRRPSEVGPATNRPGRERGHSPLIGRLVGSTRH